MFSKWHRFHHLLVSYCNSPRNSLEEGLLLNSLVLRNPLAGLSQSIRLLVVDALLRFNCHPSRLGEGHAEDVVGLDATAHAAVAGNGFSQTGGDVRVNFTRRLFIFNRGFRNFAVGRLKFKCQL